MWQPWLNLSIPSHTCLEYPNVLSSSSSWPLHWFTAPPPSLGILPASVPSSLNVDSCFCNPLLTIVRRHFVTYKYHPLTPQFKHAQQFLSSWRIKTNLLYVSVMHLSRCLVTFPTTCLCSWNSWTHHGLFCLWTAHVLWHYIHLEYIPPFLSFFFFRIFIFLITLTHPPNFPANAAPHHQPWKLHDCFLYISTHFHHVYCIVGDWLHGWVTPTDSTFLRMKIVPFLLSSTTSTIWHMTGAQ